MRLHKDSAMALFGLFQTLFLLPLLDSSFAQINAPPVSPFRNYSFPITTGIGVQPQQSAPCDFGSVDVQELYWVRVAVTATITAETVIHIVNQHDNRTRTETITAANISHYKPTDVNGAGTKTASLSIWDGYQSINTTIAFPTGVTAFGKSYEVNGVVSTTVNGVSTRLTGYPLRFAWPSDPTPSVFPTAAQDPQSIALDPRGWTYEAAREKCALNCGSNPSTIGACQQCIATCVGPVSAQEAALLLTHTTTSTETDAPSPKNTEQPHSNLMLQSSSSLLLASGGQTASDPASQPSPQPTPSTSFPAPAAPTPQPSPAPISSEAPNHNSGAGSSDNEHGGPGASGGGGSDGADSGGGSNEGSGDGSGGSGRGSSGGGGNSDENSGGGSNVGKGDGPGDSGDGSRTNENNVGENSGGGNSGGGNNDGGSSSSGSSGGGNSGSGSSSGENSGDGNSGGGSSGNEGTGSGSGGSKNSGSGDSGSGDSAGEGKPAGPGISPSQTLPAASNNNNSPDQVAPPTPVPLIQILALASTALSKYEASNDSGDNSPNTALHSPQDYITVNGHTLSLNAASPTPSLLSQVLALGSAALSDAGKGDYSAASAQLAALPLASLIGVLQAESVTSGLQLGSAVPLPALVVNDHTMTPVATAQPIISGHTLTGGVPASVSASVGVGGFVASPFNGESPSASGGTQSSRGTQSGSTPPSGGTTSFTGAARRLEANGMWITCVIMALGYAVL